MIIPFLNCIFVNLEWNCHWFVALSLVKGLFSIILAVHIYLNEISLSWVLVHSSRSHDSCVTLLNSWKLDSSGIPYPSQIVQRIPSLVVLVSFIVLIMYFSHRIHGGTYGLIARIPSSFKTHILSSSKTDIPSSSNRSNASSLCRRSFFLHLSSGTWPAHD